MKSYSEKVKQQVIERYLSGESSASILADIGIPKRHSSVGYAIIKKSKRTLIKRLSIFETTTCLKAKSFAWRGLLIF